MPSENPDEILEETLHSGEVISSPDGLAGLIQAFQKKVEADVAPVPPSKEVEYALHVIATLHKLYPTVQEFEKAHPRIYDVFYMLWEDFRLPMVRLSPVVPAAASHKSRFEWTKVEYLTFLGQLYPQDTAYVESQILLHKEKLSKRNNALEVAEARTPMEWKNTLGQDFSREEWDQVTLEYRAEHFSRLLMKKYGVGLMKLASILKIRGNATSYLKCFRKLYNFVWAD